jgi:Tfp pilus assembly protein PilF
MAIDSRALQGSAYTSLGSLYYQVPGWPIGFGDDKRAGTMLLKALEINPDGIDPNYFYGDYLFHEKRYAKARSALQRALAAPDRPGRAVADKGRRDEVRTLLVKVEAELD